MGPGGRLCPRCALSLAADPEEVDDEEVERLFPELRMEGKVARGGFGTVFRAEHRRLRRSVALKFLDPLLARQSPQAVARFEREMIAVGRLDHPGIVRAYDAGEREGHWFILMEFVEGLDLNTLSRQQGPLPVAEACEMVRQAALALHYAHERGLVHRDVKPGNLMLSIDNEATSLGDPTRLKVLDFGLSDLVTTEDQEAISTEFRGTLDYTAPEQIATPAEVDAQADVYGLGATLFRLLTGRAPHEGGGDESMVARMRRITHTAPPPVANVRKGLPPALALLCDRMMALERDLRPASALIVATQLAPFCKGAELMRLMTTGPLPEKPARRSRRKTRFLGLGVVSLVVIAATGLMLPRRPSVSVTLQGIPLLSTKEAADHGLDVATTPRLLSDHWALDSVIECGRNHRNAHLMADGSILGIAFRDAAAPQATRWRKTDQGYQASPFPLETRRGSWRAYTDPNTGMIFWTDPFPPEGSRLGRATADLQPLPWLTYADGRHSSLEAVDFVRAGSFPPDLPLKAGDLLVVDSGRGDYKGRGSLWQGRADSDAPLTLLGEDKELLTGPVDVTIGQGGVYIFNRNAGYGAHSEVTSADTTDRLIRWQGRGFIGCTVSQPIRDPSALVADPQSRDLYAAEGSSLPGGGPAQRILRLVPGDKLDVFEVEVIADRFGQLASGALTISPDGNKLIIADNALGCIFILRRLADAKPSE